MVEHPLMINLGRCLREIDVDHGHELDPDALEAMICLSPDLSVYVGTRRSRLVRTHADAMVEVLKTWSHEETTNHKG